MRWFDLKIFDALKKDPQNASDPKNANHHWYPFLRFVQESNAKGKDVSVNDWLIAQGKVKDYKEEAKKRQDAAAKAEAAAKGQWGKDKSKKLDLAYTNHR